MVEISARDVMAKCIGRTGSLSIKRDVLGVVADDNPQNRSLRHRLKLMQTDRFVRVALVTVEGAHNRIQLDLDNANKVYQEKCDAWIYCSGIVTVNAPDLLFLEQNDCYGREAHTVSAEEDKLFSLGRDLGANIVCYYIKGSSSFVASGCASHPVGRKGFWVEDERVGLWLFAHELSHIVGNNEHVDIDLEEVLNRIRAGETAAINIMTVGNPLPETPLVTKKQRDRIRNDPEMEWCSAE